MMSSLPPPVNHGSTSTTCVSYVSRPSPINRQHGERGHDLRRRVQRRHADRRVPHRCDSDSADLAVDGDGQLGPVHEALVDVVGDPAAEPGDPVGVEALRAGRAHHVVSPRSTASAPPSTNTTWPVTWVLSTLGEEASTAATASGPAWPCRGMGTDESTSSRPASEPSSSAVMGVTTVPGATALSGMPAPAHGSVGACSPDPPGERGLRRQVRHGGILGHRVDMPRPRRRRGRRRRRLRRLP